MGSLRVATHAPTEVQALAALLPGDTWLTALSPAEADIANLHPLESLLIRGESAERSRQFAAGRHCARRAMATLGLGPAPLLRRRDGAPDWPLTLRGSITHKSGLCLALVGLAAEISGIGIDLEPSRALPAPLWRRVFTDAELRLLDPMPPARQAISARLRFSAKESYYKWYRSQGGVHESDFADVEVDVRGDALNVRPVAGTGLPDVRGCCVQGSTWLITALWSNAGDPTPRVSVESPNARSCVPSTGLTIRP